MAHVITNRFKRNVLNKSISLSADGIYIALLAPSVSAVTSNIYSMTNWSQLSAYEATGTGYTAHGKLLTGKTITQDDTGNYSKWDADDLTWSDSILSAAGAAYIVSGSNDLIGYMDYGSTKVSNNGNFIHQHNSSFGILKVI